jgi:hypothetical protein
MNKHLRCLLKLPLTVILLVPLVAIFLVGMVFIFFFLGPLFLVLNASGCNNVEWGDLIEIWLDSMENVYYFWRHV